VLVWLDGRGPGDGGTWRQRELQSRPDGTYRADFKKGNRADIRGLDRIAVAWTNERGDYVRNRAVAPGVHVHIGRSWIDVAGQPGFDATLKLLDRPRGAVIAATGGIVYTGANAFLWLDENGEEVRALEGNQVNTDLAADASFVVPTLATWVNRRSDVVRLDTGLGRGIGVLIEVRNANCGSWASLNTRADGSVRVDFTGDEDVQHCDFVRGDRIVVTVRLRSGDQVTKLVVVE
jgi:hypothetical protein